MYYLRSINNFHYLYTKIYVSAWWHSSGLKKALKCLLAILVRFQGIHFTQTKITIMNEGLMGILEEAFKAGILYIDKGIDFEEWYESLIINSTSNLDIISIEVDGKIYYL